MAPGRISTPFRLPVTQRSLFRNTQVRSTHPPLLLDARIRFCLLGDPDQSRRSAPRSCKLLLSFVKLIAPCPNILPKTRCSPSPASPVWPLSKFAGQGLDPFPRSRLPHNYNTLLSQPLTYNPWSDFAARPFSFLHSVARAGSSPQPGTGVLFSTLFTQPSAPLFPVLGPSSESTLKASFGVFYDARGQSGPAKPFQATSSPSDWPTSPPCYSFLSVTLRSCVQWLWAALSIFMCFSCRCWEARFSFPFAYETPSLPTNF